MSIPAALSVQTFSEANLPERIGVPSVLDPAQQEAADELVNGPRGGVYGPFRPLLHQPPLLRAVAKVGETLRYEGTLDAALREWVICVVARELGNVFEWQMHRPLAAKAGVPERALAALEAGTSLPPDMRNDLAVARLVIEEMLRRHRITDATYDLAKAIWEPPALVELLTLAGYFAMVSWLMNVARTPGNTG
jgi:4-carboxymuconolactone decarboxylase